MGMNHLKAEHGWLRCVWRLYIVGIVTSLAASLCTALLEFIVLSLHATAHADVPGRIILAAFGRTLLTHACCVLPVMLLLSLLVSAIFARKRAPRIDAWHAGCVVMVGGILVAYASVALRHQMRFGPLRIEPWHTILATAICTLVVLGAVYWIAGSKLFVWYRRALKATALAGIVLFVTAPFLLWGTPLSGPDAYRLPPSVLLEEGRAPKTTGPPNVLFIVLDTVRADHLSHYGYARRTAPFLNECADNGITFDRALAAGVPTTPSHASMFTGLSVREHGVGAGQNALDARFETMAERASAVGFQTVALSCNVNVDVAFNFLQGFDATYQIWGMYTYSGCFLDHWIEQLGLTHPMKWLERDNGAATVTHQVAEWVGHGYEPDKPFLMFINYMEAHSPDRPPLSYRRRYLGAADVRRSYELDRQYRGIVTDVGAIGYALDPTLVGQEDIRIYKAMYDASIHYMDERLGELFQLLKLNGMLDNTVVIIVSDHGEGLGDHGIFRHGLSIYDMLYRVPLTIYVPRDQPSGKRVQEAVSTAGLFDVVCAAIGAEQCPEAQTLAQVLVDRMGGEPAVSELPATARGPALELALSNGARPNEGLLRTYRSVNDATTKYIMASDRTEELYDISTDPGELDNLADALPGSVQLFSDQLTKWLENTQEFVPPSSGTGMSASQAEILRSLGYAVP